MVKNKIEKDIDVLVENSLITPDQALKICEFYSKKDVNFIQSSLLLPLIGVLLIGAGFIAICASNWEQMTDITRIIIAFIPIVILSLALFKYRLTSSGVLIQCLTFGVAFAFLFAFGIIANIYQTPVSTDILIHIGLFCVIPLVYVFDAYWLGIIALIGGIVSSDTDYLIISIIGLLLLTPYCYFKIKNNANINMMILVHVLALFRLTTLINENYLSFYITLAILLILTIFYKNNMLNTVVKVICYLLGVYNCFDSSFNYYFINMKFQEQMATLVFIALFLFCLYYVVQNLYNKITKNEKIFYFSMLSILSLVLFFVVGIDTEVIATILMVFIFGYNAFNYFLDMDLKGYNKYSFLFSGLILAKMTSLDLPFFEQGILFIVLGIVFIMVSQYVAKLIKNNQADLLPIVEEVANND